MVKADTLALDKMEKSNTSRMPRPAHTQIKRKNQVTAVPP